ncbi:MAG: SidJ-related pseudokinase, partial [Candidatus Omnitrophica bacterium]|nr:SidJ-related pseudokinase [Candidatus Omnitrophota bacterium]
MDEKNLNKLTDFIHMLELLEQNFRDKLAVIDFTIDGNLVIRWNSKLGKKDKEIRRNIYKILKWRGYNSKEIERFIELVNGYKEKQLEVLKELGVQERLDISEEEAKRATDIANAWLIDSLSYKKIIRRKFLGILVRFLYSPSLWLWQFYKEKLDNILSGKGNWLILKESRDVIILLIISDRYSKNPDKHYKEEINNNDNENKSLLISSLFSLNRLYFKYPRLTAYVFAPLLENLCLALPSVLILWLLPSLWALCMVSLTVFITVLYLTFYFHRLVFIGKDKTPTIATRNEQKKIFRYFSGIGVPFILMAGLKLIPYFNLLIMNMPIIFFSVVIGIYLVGVLSHSLHNLWVRYWDKGELWLANKEIKGCLTSISFKNKDYLPDPTHSYNHYKYGPIISPIQPGDVKILQDPELEWVCKRILPPEGFLREETHQGADFCYFEDFGGGINRYPPAVCVRAISDGKIIYIYKQDHSPYYNSVLLVHSLFNNSGVFFSRYLHIDVSKDINQGDNIKQGDILGRLSVEITGWFGKYGRQEPHLHFECVSVEELDFDLTNEHLKKVFEDKKRKGNLDNPEEIFSFLSSYQYRGKIPFSPYLYDVDKKINSSGYTLISLLILIFISLFAFFIGIVLSEYLIINQSLASINLIPTILIGALLNNGNTDCIKKVRDYASKVKEGLIKPEDIGAIEIIQLRRLVEANNKDAFSTIEELSDFFKFVILHPQVKDYIKEEFTETLECAAIRGSLLAFNTLLFANRVSISLVTEKAIERFHLTVKGPNVELLQTNYYPLVSINDITKKLGEISNRRFISRKIIYDLPENNILVIKLLRENDNIVSLLREAFWMKYISKLKKNGYFGDVRFDIPIPLCFVGSYVVRIDDDFNDIANEITLHPHHYALCFIANNEYFYYPNETDNNKILSPEEFIEVMCRNAYLLGKLASLGIIYYKSLYHNRIQLNRNDEGIYLWWLAGRLDSWLSSCDYPDISKTGIRDYEHFISFGVDKTISVYENSMGLYHFVGDQILRLFLIVGSYFRNKDRNRIGLDSQGEIIDTRDLFDKKIFKEAIEGILLNYYSGFTGEEYQGELPFNLDKLIDSMINKMGLDTDMYELFRKDDQLLYSKEEFKKLLKNYGYEEADKIHRGEDDIFIITGPHLGRFGEGISIPEMISSIEKISALCLFNKHWNSKNNKSDQILAIDPTAWYGSAYYRCSKDKRPSRRFLAQTIACYISPIWETIRYFRNSENIVNFVNVHKGVSENLDKLIAYADSWRLILDPVFNQKIKFLRWLLWIMIAPRVICKHYRYNHDIIINRFKEITPTLVNDKKKKDILDVIDFSRVINSLPEYKRRRIISLKTKVENSPSCFNWYILGKEFVKIGFYHNAFNCYQMALRCHMDRGKVSYEKLAYAIAHLCILQKDYTQANVLYQQIITQKEYALKQTRKAPFLSVIRILVASGVVDDPDILEKNIDRLNRSIYFIKILERMEKAISLPLKDICILNSMGVISPINLIDKNRFFSASAVSYNGIIHAYISKGICFAMLASNAVDDEMGQKQMFLELALDNFKIAIASLKYFGPCDNSLMTRLREIIENYQRIIICMLCHTSLKWYRTCYHPEYELWPKRKSGEDCEVKIETINKCILMHDGLTMQEEIIKQVLELYRNTAQEFNSLKLYNAYPWTMRVKEKRKNPNKAYIDSGEDNFIPKDLDTIIMSNQERHYYISVSKTSQINSETNFGKYWSSLGFTIKNLEQNLDLGFSQYLDLDILKQRINELLEIIIKTAPELTKQIKQILPQIIFYITNDPDKLGFDYKTKLPYGASCKIEEKKIYLHIIDFFSHSPAKQIEILYHELISHIVKGITDENEAMNDTEEFIITYYTEETLNFECRGISYGRNYQEILSLLISKLRNNDINDLLKILRQNENKIGPKFIRIIKKEAELGNITHEEENTLLNHIYYGLNIHHIVRRNVLPENFKVNSGDVYSYLIFTMVFLLRSILESEGKSYIDKETYNELIREGIVLPQEEKAKYDGKLIDIISHFQNKEIRKKGVLSPCIDKDTLKVIVEQWRKTKQLQRGFILELESCCKNISEEEILEWFVENYKDGVWLYGDGRLNLFVKGDKTMLKVRITGYEWTKVIPRLITETEKKNLGIDLYVWDKNSNCQNLRLLRSLVWDNYEKVFIEPELKTRIKLKPAKKEIVHYICAYQEPGCFIPTTALPIGKNNNKTLLIIGKQKICLRAGHSFNKKFAYLKICIPSSILPLSSDTIKYRKPTVRIEIYDEPFADINSVVRIVYFDREKGLLRNQAEEIIYRFDNWNVESDFTPEPIVVRVPLKTSAIQLKRNYKKEKLYLPKEYVGKLVILKFVKVNLDNDFYKGVKVYSIDEEGNPQKCICYKYFYKEQSFNSLKMINININNNIPDNERLEIISFLKDSFFFNDDWGKEAREVFNKIKAQKANRNIDDRYLGEMGFVYVNKETVKESNFVYYINDINFGEGKVIRIDYDNDIETNFVVRFDNGITIE